MELLGEGCDTVDMFGVVTMPQLIEAVFVLEFGSPLFGCAYPDGEPGGFRLSVLVPFLTSGGLVIVVAVDESFPASALPGPAGGIGLGFGVVDVPVEVLELASDTSGGGVLVGAGACGEVVGSGA